MYHCVGCGGAYLFAKTVCVSLCLGWWVLWWARVWGHVFSICMVPGFAGAAPRPGHAKRTNRLPIIQHSNLSNTLQQHNTHTHITLGALYKINKIRCITTTVCKFTKLRQRTTQQHEKRHTTQPQTLIMRPARTMSIHECYSFARNILAQVMARY